MDQTLEYIDQNLDKKFDDLFEKYENSVVRKFWVESKIIPIVSYFKVRVYKGIL